MLGSQLGRVPAGVTADYPGPVFYIKEGLYEYC